MARNEEPKVATLHIRDGVTTAILTFTRNGENHRLVIDLVNGSMKLVRLETKEIVSEEKPIPAFQAETTRPEGGPTE